MPTAAITIPSLVSPGAKVTIDPYKRNPIVDDAMQCTMRIPKTPAPRMFGAGASDTPVFCASGLDPNLLLRLPYGVRHHAAASADPAEVHAIFEQYAADPYARIAHQGFDEAVQRVRAWIIDDI